MTSSVPGAAWQNLGERPLVETPWFQLRQADVELPGGRRVDHYLLRLPPLVLTAVVDDRERVLLLWRHRFIPDTWAYELPSGIAAQAEDLAEAAVRQALAESGWEPVRPRRLLTLHPCSGLTDAAYHIYWTRQAIHRGEPAAAFEAERIDWIPLASDRVRCGWRGQNALMTQGNEQAAAVLEEYAELLVMTGGDPFRARVYTKAAQAIAAHPRDVADLPPADLLRIPGVGKSIAAKIADITTTGSFAELEDLRADIPDGVRQLTRIPALGPRRALQLYQELGVSSPDQLRDAIAAGRLGDLKGFGPKSAEKLSHGLDLLASAGGRVLLNVAAEAAAAVIDVVGPVPGCEQITAAGSLRRAAESIGDVDVLAAATDSAPLMAALAAMPDVAVIASGPTKASIRTAAGLQVDLRVVPPDCWGAALQYFTGSKQHNIAIRELAVHQKLKLSEYGLFDAETSECIASRTEEEVYERLGLAWIPPVLREDTGEVAAARTGALPVLVTDADARGDLHTHTNLTDGKASLADMVAAASARGFEYYAITDHAPNLVMQRMTDEKMLAQREQVRDLGRQLAADAGAARTAMTLLHGTELNIAPDGTVDWPADFLAGFDLCVASVHSHFDLPRREMTRRFITACENPYVNVIGHPLTRKIGRRPPVDVDLPELFRACARTGTALEVNAHPARLDLPSAHIRAARDAGVRFAIDSDAHSLPDLDYLQYGVATAQRGWLTAEDVITTWPLPRLTEFLRKGR